MHSIIFFKFLLIINLTAFGLQQTNIGFITLMRSANYSIITINSSYDSNVLLLGKTKTFPSLLFNKPNNSYYSDAEFFNEGMYSNHYSQLIIPSQSSEKKVYLSVFSFASLKQTNFLIKIEYFNNSFCVNSCSGNGNCVLGVCICSDFYSGLDCSIPYDELQLPTTISGAIPSYSYKFFRIKLNKNANSPTIEIDGKYNSNTFCYFLNNENNNLWPSMFLYDQSSFVDNNSIFSVSSQGTHLSLFMSLFCDQDTDCFYDIKYSQNVSYKSQYYIIIALVCTIALFVTLGVPFAVVYYCKRRRQNFHYINHISSENLNVLFPESLWNSLNNENSVCSICFETFDNESRVRILYCQHVFHSECIDQWACLQAVCPMCKVVIGVN